MKKVFGVFFFLLLVFALLGGIYLFIQYSELKQSIHKHNHPIEIQENFTAKKWQKINDIMPQSQADLNELWVQRGEWKLENGILKTASKKNQDQILLYKMPIQGDVAFEFKAKVPNQETLKMGGDISVILLSDKYLNRRYDLQAIVGKSKESSKAIIQMIDIPLSQKKYPMEVGKTYQIRGESEKNKLRLFIDNNLVLETHNVFFLGGSFHGIYSWGADKEFWDLKFYIKKSPFLNDPLKSADLYLSNALGHPYVDQSRFSQARAAYLDLLEVSSNLNMKKELLKRLAIVERETKNYDLMQKYVDEYVKLDNSFQAQLLKAESYLYQKMESEAIDVYTACIESYPEHRVELAVSLHTILIGAKGQMISTPSKMILWEMMLKYTLINHLDAKRLSLESISFLKSDKIKSLFFNWNKIASIDSLSIYKKLRVLSLANNNIADISTLKPIEIDQLYIDSNPITKLDALENKTIKTLFISDILANDFNVIASLKKLEHLHISGNQITNFDFLRDLSLKNLGISGTSLPDLKFINGERLKYLNIGLNPIREFSSSRFPVLKVLNMDHTLISDLKEVSKLKLKVLNIDHTKVESLAPYYESPPEKFYFNSKSISDEELVRAAQKWENSPSARNAYLSAKLYLALRQENISQKTLEGIRHKGPTGHFYLPIPIKLSYEDAKSFCQKQGGYLLSITTQKEMEFVKGLHNFYQMWLGLHQKDQVLEWENEEPFYFNNFYRKNVKLFKESMHYYSVGGDFWHAQKSDDKSKMYFMIEWDK